MSSGPHGHIFVDVFDFYKFTMNLNAIHPIEPSQQIIIKYD